MRGRKFIYNVKLGSEILFSCINSRKFNFYMHITIQSLSPTKKYRCNTGCHKRKSRFDEPDKPEQRGAHVSW